MRAEGADTNAMELARLVEALVLALVEARGNLKTALPRKHARTFIERLDDDFNSMGSVLALALQELLAVARENTDDDVWADIAETCMTVLLADLCPYEERHGMVGL